MIILGIFISTVDSPWNGFGIRMPLSSGAEFEARMLATIESACRSAPRALRCRGRLWAKDVIVGTIKRRSVPA
jgi:hypothetical protein